MVILTIDDLTSITSIQCTFPGMWTNTCCSHALCVYQEYDEGSDNGGSINKLAEKGAKNDAQRKLDHELGI
ncbi:hypothetical protein JA1_003557 [Spathaspora sp. JA1]|nr:hypothetical protein JA1_003557 [Spathaspora sp. JA1]